jgi:hypothetical protein
MRTTPALRPRRAEQVPSVLCLDATPQRDAAPRWSACLRAPSRSHPREPGPLLHVSAHLPLRRRECFPCRRKEFSFPLDPPLQGAHRLASRCRSSGVGHGPRIPGLAPRPSPKLRGEARASSPLSGEREGVGDREGWDGHPVLRDARYLLPPQGEGWDGGGFTCRVILLRALRSDARRAAASLTPTGSALRQSGTAPRPTRRAARRWSGTVRARPR